MVRTVSFSRGQTLQSHSRSEASPCKHGSVSLLWTSNLLLQLFSFELSKEIFSSSSQALLLNGSLPEDEQEGSFELCEHGACPEEQLVSTLLCFHFSDRATSGNILPQTGVLHSSNHGVLCSDHNPKSSGPECGRKSRPKG